LNQRMCVSTNIDAGETHFVAYEILSTAP